MVLVDTKFELSTVTIITTSRYKEPIFLVFIINNLLGSHERDQNLQ